MDVLNIVYLVAAVLIFVSIMATTLSARLGLPLLLFFLGVGMLAGEEGVFGLHFEQYALANFIGQAALACILLDGGLRTSFASFRVGLKPALVLATWGVVATVGILGAFCAYVLGVDWRLGMLMAAIVGSTDAAAVFGLLRNGGVKLNARVQSTLELESGMNDPLAILLVTVLIALNLDPDSQSWSDILLMLIKQIGVGLAVGATAGVVLSKLLPKVRLAEGMYAILIMSAGFAVFSATNLLGGSGFLAVYLAGVVIGNKKVRATEHVLRVMDSFAWLSQAVLFVVLGLLVTPSALLEVWVYSLLIFLCLLCFARPLAVATSLLPFGFAWREVGFISWVGLRGAVPITLAILPVMMAVPNASLAFNIAFGVVVLSLLVQGASIPFMAKTFGVWLPSNDEPKAEHEIWVGDEANLTFYEFEVKKGAFAIGRNPLNISSKFNEKQVKLLAVVRAQKLLVIEPDTRLIQGDHVWYALSGGDDAKSIAKIFNNALTQYQKTSEFYGDWLLSPNLKLSDLPCLPKRFAPPMQFSGLDILGVFTPTKPTNNVVEKDFLALVQANKSKTIAQYMYELLPTSFVVGDRIALGEHWVLIVRSVDEEGNLTGVGLKNLNEQSQDSPQT